MSFPTQPAFVHYGDWDDNTRSHPAMKFMEAYTGAFEQRAWEKPHDIWITDDHVFVHSDGTVHKGAEATWALVKEVYGPFIAYHFQPYFLVCWEVDKDTYEMMGQATFFAHLPGDPVAGEQKVTDNKGRQWDIALPGGFKFQYKKADHAKNGHGYLLNGIEVSFSFLAILDPYLILFVGGGAESERG